jgi:cell division transport system permease protein
LETLGGENPLPDYLVVKVSNSGFVKKTASKINNLPNINSVDYGQDYLDKLLNLLYWGRLIGGGVVILFLISVIFLIANTIRLTIYARSKEIQIMKFVGATNWFIRWPFLIEGMVLGLMGSLIAAAVISVSYIVLIDKIAQYVSFIPLIKDTAVLYVVGLIMICLGSMLGGFASFLSLGKHLRF